MSRDHDDNKKVVGFLDGDLEITVDYCEAWLFLDYNSAARAARNSNYNLPGEASADVCKVPLPEFVHTVDYT